MTDQQEGINGETTEIVVCSCCGHDFRLPERRFVWYEEVLLCGQCDSSGEGDIE